MYNVFVIYLQGNQSSIVRMKWSELKRKAIQCGWYLVRNGKEHDIYAHADKDYEIQIPRHDSHEVKTGLFHKLKKQIGF